MTKIKKTKSQQREQTRIRILQAVLDIIISEGIRSVRHRAVAERANVSLGTTTYHFSDIEDLIVSAFGYWRIENNISVNPYYEKIVNLLLPYQNSKVPASKRNAIAKEVYELSVGYTHHQLTHKYDDLLVELAFYNECLRFDSLRELMLKTRDIEIEFLEIIHHTFGSECSQEDAWTTFSLFRQLEQSAIVNNLVNRDGFHINKTLHRHMSLTLKANFAVSKLGIRTEK